MKRDKKEIFKRLIIHFWEREIAFVPRELVLPLDINLIVTIVGPRRAGKTYRLFQLASELWQNLHKRN
jgi:predicted AAA+ superfamily ATPase